MSFPGFQIGPHLTGIQIAGFDEFSYQGGKVVRKNSGESFNALYDEKILEEAAVNQEPDIVRELQIFQNNFSEVERVVLWIQWFIEPDGDVDHAQWDIYPAVNTFVNSGIADPTDWQVNGLDASTATVLEDPDQTGTSSDDALLWIYDELKSLGYEVGLYLTFIGDSKDDLRWRGSLGTLSSADVTTIVSNYDTFIKYYIDLFANHVAGGGAEPDLIALGSELQSLTKEEPPADPSSNFPFVQELIDLAAYSKANLPNTTTTYAALWTEYSFREAEDGGIYFPLDALFMDSNFDLIGIDAYFPLAEQHTTDYDTLRENITDGPEWDYDWLRNKPDEWGDGGNLGRASKLDGTGRLEGTFPVLDAPRFRRKDLRNALRSWFHWRAWGDRANFARDKETEAEKLQLKGGISNPVFGGSIDEKPGGFKTEASLSETDTWMTFDKDNESYMDGTSPDLSGGATGYKVSVDVDWSEGSSDFPRILRIANIFNLQWRVSTTELQLNVQHAGGNQFFNLGTLAAGRHKIEIEVRDDRSVVVTVDDAAFASVTLANDPVRPNGEGFFLMTHSGGTDFLSGTMYWVKLEVLGGSSYTWTFQDTFQGFRTSWVPGTTPFCITEFGMTSINSAPVEPDITPQIQNGEPFGPWNTNFQIDQIVQAIGIRAQVDEYNQWIEDGELDSYYLYAYDTRSTEVIIDLYKDDPSLPNQVIADGGPSPWYRDRNEFAITHFVNGKIVEREDPLWPLGCSEQLNSYDSPPPSGSDYSACEDAPATSWTRQN